MTQRVGAGARRRESAGTCTSRSHEARGARRTGDAGLYRSDVCGGCQVELPHELTAAPRQVLQALPVTRFSARCCCCRRRCRRRVTALTGGGRRRRSRLVRRRTRLRPRFVWLSALLACRTEPDWLTCEPAGTVRSIHSCSRLPRRIMPSPGPRDSRQNVGIMSLSCCKGAGCCQLDSGQ